jgi:hypothetical protein
MVNIITVVLVVCVLAALAWGARVMISIRETRYLGRETSRELESAISGASAMLYRYRSERAPQAQAEIQRQLRLISLGLAQLDTLQRRRYRARISEIASSAAREGISISPPGW